MKPCIRKNLAQCKCEALANIPETVDMAGISKKSFLRGIKTINSRAQKKIFLLIWCCSLLFASAINAQDNSSRAENAYFKAEEFFSNNDYGSALTQLAEAERLLGATNPKIMYFKIQILRSQFLQSSNNYPLLRGSINRFFEIVNKETFSPEKYREIIRLQSDLDDFKRSDSIASARLLENGGLAALNDYLSKTPNTFNFVKLDQKRRELQKEQDLINAKNELTKRLAELDDELSAARGKSFRKRYWGGMAFAIGGLAGAALIQDASSDGSSDDPALSALKPIGAGLCFAASVIGAMNLIGGNRREVKSLKAEREKLMQRKKELGLSVAPYYRNAYGSDIVGLKFRLSF
ncbi:MAG TPA: hypothetical protein PK339_01725 [Flavitalea sp.]|nr:hypothetical protein [Flavitalea sp.]